MELIKKIYTSATKGNTSVELTKGKVFPIITRKQKKRYPCVAL